MRREHAQQSNTRICSHGHLLSHSLLQEALAACEQQREQTEEPAPTPTGPVKVVALPHPTSTLPVVVSPDPEPGEAV